jgi:purine-nucleoside phosphorylase
MTEQAFEAFAARCRESPPLAFIVLGSGLGLVADRVEPLATIDFAAIPQLAASAVSGHRGRWTLGKWAGVPVVVSEGRLHYYEGHPWEVVVRPVQQAAELGARYALFTNAAGGIRDDLGPGSLLPIRDHLEWNRPYPWREAPRTPPYSPRLVGQVVEAAAALGLKLRPGVYAAVSGPSYETPAEIRALRSAGADAVGMSTSREAAAAVWAGLECAAVSLVTNRAAGLSGERLSHEEVLAAGRVSARKLAALLEGVLRRLG